MAKEKNNITKVASIDNGLQVASELARGPEHEYMQKNKEYVVTIYGDITIINSRNSRNESNESYADKIIEILQWGETGLERIYLAACTNLRKIASPTENSFININPQYGFYETFYGCTSLTTIPENLFGNCPNVQDFYCTFYGCTSLTSIPENLFANCTNVNSFEGTFYECTSLTGNAIHLWERVENGNSNGYQGEPDGEGCYYGCEGLENYNNIPDYWKQKEMPN